MSDETLTPYTTELAVKLARHTADIDSERLCCSCGALFEGQSQLDDKRAWARHALEKSGVLAALDAARARIETLETESRHYQHEAESWRQEWSGKQDEYRQCLDDGFVLAKATEDQHENYMRLDAIARQLCAQRDAAIAVLREWGDDYLLPKAVQKMRREALAALTADDAKETK